MCGIVGLCLTDDSVQPEQIAAMNATIVHRGPDGEGHHVDRNVGIGMRRLSIIDLHGGWQPIPNETGDIQVVQNGEIYNYLLLRKELESQGHTFKTNSDTEAIVHAYEQWGGYEFATKLRGMYGIAVWDSRSRELWIARDRIGIKPLYYVKNNKGFAFASEVKALLASPIVDAEIDPDTLSEYLTFGSADVDRSFVKGVRQLMPGCVIRYSTETGDMQIHRYWEFGFPEPRLDLSEAEAAEALDAKLQETIKLHLASDVPLGAFLSGGVDSSAVVGMVAEAGITDLKTFSIGFDDEEFNELPYAREVAAKWGCDHHERIVYPDAIEVIDKLVHHLDEPFADASAIPTWYVSKLAAEHVKVVLSGDGGDELFAGYDRFVTANDRLYLDRVPRLLRKFGASLSHVLPPAFPGKNFLNYAALDAAGRYATEHCLFPILLQNRLLRPEFDPRSKGNPHPLDRSMELFRGYGASDYMSNCMQFDTNRYLPMDILVKVDRMTMAHSIESRPPLLDHELIEFAASLPTGFKYRPPNHKKYLLRKVAERVVPKHLMDRKKAGFAVPLQSWFAGPLRPMFEDSVLADGKSIQFLNPDTIREMLAENNNGRRDHGLRLWAILMFELWLRQMPTHKPQLVKV